jgi:hypothetical protein
MPNTQEHALLLNHTEIALLEALVAREAFLRSGFDPAAQAVMDAAVEILSMQAGPRGVIGLLVRLGKMHCTEHELNGPGDCCFPTERITDDLLAELLAAAIAATPKAGAA